jgi:hypothetical protein
MTGIMTGDGQSSERLRDYLRDLKPEARAMLLQELERGLLRGEGNAGNDLILQELRKAARAEAQPVPRIGDAARLFFAPLEPFLIDGSADHKRIGRVARLALEPIWSWLGRDLIPAEAKTLTEDINRALLENDRAKADEFVRVLHDTAVGRMSDAVAEAAADDKARRRLPGQIGTPRALDDLSTVLAVLALRDVLTDLSRRWPSHVRSFERDQADHLKAILDFSALRSSSENRHVKKSDVYLYGSILAMNRLAAPWQLIRFATRAADSDDTARIAETPYAVAVAIVLNEVEWMVGELRTELKAGRPTAVLLKNIHDAARALRSELNLSADSAWSRQLAAIRADVSGLLKVEIEATPGLVRRLLRPRPAKDIAPGTLLDTIDVNDAEARVESLHACRHYASELAINEATMRAYSELTLHLESGTKVLLDSLRHAGDGDRPFRQSQLDAAIRFCRIVFGAEYAGLLAKAAEVAGHTAAAERRFAPA